MSEAAEYIEVDSTAKSETNAMPCLLYPSSGSDTDTVYYSVDPFDTECNPLQFTFAGHNASPGAWQQHHSTETSDQTPSPLLLAMVVRILTTTTTQRVRAFPKATLPDDAHVVRGVISEEI